MTWPKLLAIDTYRKTAYACDPPTLRTLKTLIRKGKLPGQIQGNRYYVLVDQNLQAFYAPTSASNPPVYTDGKPIEPEPASATKAQVDATIEQWLKNKKQHGHRSAA